MTLHERSDPWPFSTAASERLYVIGDIHGEFRALQNVMRGISDDLNARPPQMFRIIFLGDYIDRGEESRNVLDLVATLSRQFDIVALRGNHEAMLLDALDDSESFLSWRQYGGLETLTSFGIPIANVMRGREIDETRRLFKETLGEARLQFLNALPFTYQNGDYAFCHAGIRPGLPMALQEPRDLAWIRDQFLLSDVQHEKFIVHGHTPVEQIDIKFNRINIDTGAYLTGRLTCLILEGNQIGYFDSKSPHITSIF